MISRNQEHELIMISIYDALIYSEMDEVFSLEDIMEGVFMLPYDDIPLFSKEIVIKSLTNVNDIKKEQTFSLPYNNLTVKLGQCEIANGEITVGANTKVLLCGEKKF